MAKKYASDKTLSALATKIKELFATKTDINTELAKKANSSHTHSISDTTNLQSTLDGKVPTSRTINSKPLSENIILSASDVGAASSTHNHDSDYFTQDQINNRLSHMQSQIDEKIDEKSNSAASSAVSTHNTSTSSHNDIRALITNLTTKLNNFLDVDDTTSDQLSEVITLINNNKGTLESLTTSKINVSDIVDNLTTSSTSKVLSAKQGVAIKSLIDALQAELDAIPQSDWNQSDSTKLDYIKNRTHWSKTESTVISEETVDTSDYTYTFATPFVLNIGQTYIVVFDGVTYNCVAFRDNMNYNRATIGGSYGNFSTYPFSICVKSSGDTCIETDVLGTHTVKVTNVNETIQQLDEKYIPDTFAKSTDVEVAINDVEDALTNRIDKKANTSDISSGYVANVVTTLSTSNWKGVAYGNDKYVAVGDRKFAYSTDGVSWTYGTLPFYANGIAYGNGMFCAYGYSEKTVCYSTDGINWNTADTNYNSNKFSIYFLNDKFVISAGSAILSSSDCVTWSKFTLSESCTLYGGAYGNGVYIMSGYGDTFISTNGTSWTKSTALSTTENYGSIFFVDGKFVAIAHGTTNYGSSNKVAYSTNGTSWTYGTLPKSASWVEAAYCNGAFMVAGYKSLVYSNDGVNWKIGSLPEGWNTIETMGSGNEFLLFEGSGDEVAIARENPFDLVFKSDNTKTLIYDSGAITAKANSISNINISGYKKVMVAVACVNDGSNVSKSGAAIFKSNDGTTYQFPIWTNLFSTSTDVISGGVAQFEIMDSYLFCPFASRSIRTSNFFSNVDGGTADNMAMTGSGLLKCTKDITTLTVSSLDQDTSCSFGVGSRVLVWGWNC